MENQERQSVVERVSADFLDELFPKVQLENKEVKEEVKPIEEILQPLPEIIQEKVEPTPSIVDTTDHSKKLKSLIADGLIENFSIDYNTDGESIQVFLDDIEDLTEEGYKQILQQIKTAKKDEVDSKYISKEGLDDSFLKVIETRKAGGDITEQLRVNVTAIDQLTQLKENIDNEQVQINIVGHALQQQGLKPRVVQAQIDAHIEDGTLENEANSILNSHLTTHQQAIENKKQAELQRVEKEKEDVKTLRKDLTNTYKEMGIPENMYKVFIDNSTKLDQDKISNTDKLYFEAIKDPKQYAKITMLLNNPEAFEKYITSPAVTKAKIELTTPAFKININNTNKPKLSPNGLIDQVDEIFKSNNKQ